MNRNSARAHGIGPSPLTGSPAVRYASDMKDQWKQGLQWGALAWLGWVAVRSAVAASHGASTVVAVAWLAALALTWTRWSRVGVGAALLVQAAAGISRAASYEGEMHVPWMLTFFVPMSLPLLPLLFIAPERPRLTLALAFVGRWRDAARSLAGFRWIAVAGGVLLLNRAAWRALGWRVDALDGELVFDPWAILTVFAPPAVLCVLAALPEKRPRSTA